MRVFSGSAGDDLQWATAVELSARIRRRDISPVEVVQSALDRLENIEPQLNAFVTTTPEIAIAAARAAEAALMRGGPMPLLAGLPISLKDNIPLAGVPLTFGSRTARNKIALADAPVVERLLASGASIVGKTTMTEFGFKGSSDSPLTGLTRNPHDWAKSAGGSSSGAAASVAAGVTPFSVGTDGGGSLRIPASFCGVVAFKAQLGRVPVYPLPAAPSLFHIGPIARSVRDTALLLQVLAGYDSRDALSVISEPGTYLDYCNGEISGWRIAWSPTLGFADVDRDVLAIVRSAVRVFEDLGCIVDEVESVSDDPTEIQMAEFYLGAAARLKNVMEHERELLDPELAELLDRAAKISGTDYFEAHFARHRLRDRLLNLFKSHKLLLTPTLPVTAFSADQTRPPGRPDATVFSWPSYPAIFNLTGFPAASVPCGFTQEGLPVGLQIAAGPNAESDIFAAAAAFETARPWVKQKPNLGWKRNRSE